MSQKTNRLRPSVGGKAEENAAVNMGREEFPEKVYLEAFPDVADAVRDGLFPSAYDHFLSSGREEIERGQRANIFSLIQTAPEAQDPFSSEIVTKIIKSQTKSSANPPSARSTVDSTASDLVAEEVAVRPEQFARIRHDEVQKAVPPGDRSLSEVILHELSPKMDRASGSRNSPAASGTHGLVGCIEGISDSGISGWVWRAATPGTRLTVCILLDGTPVGTALADSARPDLVDAGIGDGAHAFAWAYPPGLLDGRPHRVEVRVDGEPVRVGLGVESIVTFQNRILGKVDNVIEGVLSGWAMDLRSPEHPAEIGVFIGEEMIARGKCDRFHPALWERYRGHGFYGFRIKLARRLERPDYGRLRLVVLPGTTPLVMASDIESRLPLAEAPVAKQSRGHLDRADRTGIAGWAVNEAVPDQPLAVDIHVNEAIIRSTIAANLRNDLKKPFPTSEGRLGYNYQLPHGLSLDGVASVNVTLATTRQSVRNSPMTVKIGRVGKPYDSPALRQHNLRHRTLFLANHRPVVKSDEMPRVCGIVLNRNGATFLENLFSSLWLHNSYKKFDLLIIDHGSGDGSEETCRRWSDRLAIRFVDRKANFSYSASNNFGVTLTDADILFFLNNDINLDSDCIPAAVAHLTEDIGIVGLRLATPPAQVRLGSGTSRETLLDVGYTMDQIQHLGVRISTACDDRPFIPFEEPINRNNEVFATRPMEVPAVTAAALFVSREDFVICGGFHEEYFYGFEDVDFCLTMRATLSKKIICLNDQKAYHYRSASIERSTPAERQIKALNHHILLRRLGAHVQATLRQERIDNTPFLGDAPLQIGFAVSEISELTPAGDYFTALELASELSDQFGFECRFIAREDWYDLRDCDVVIAMVDGFRPSQIVSARSNIVLIVWARNWFDSWLNMPELESFDRVWASSALAKEGFGRKTRAPIDILRIATRPERFSRGTDMPALHSDYCFTGSYFGSWRQIIGCLAPAELPYEFKLFGHGWDEVLWLLPYWQGPKAYTAMPDIYASTKIVIDDANHTTLAWGSTNSRVFDALAAGALVLTNSQTASDDSFDGALPVFSDRESLTALLRYYLDDETARLVLVAQLQTIVCERHTYAQRAGDAQSTIVQLQRCRRVWLRLPDDQAMQLEPLQQIIKASLVNRGYLVQASSNTTGLARARAFGAEIEFRITGIEDGALPVGDVGPHRCNILLICCELDQLRPVELKKYDIIVTPDEVAARQLGEAGLRTVALSLLAQQPKVSAIERRLQLQSLLDRRLGQLILDIGPLIEEILAKKAEVPLAVAPTLQPVISAAVGDDSASILRIAYVLWDFPALSQTFVLNEIRWLARHSYDVKVYFHVEPDRPAQLDFEVDSYRVRNSDELVSLLRAHERTVIHSPFAYPATALLTYPASVATGIPFTMMPAGVDISHYVNIGRNKLAEVTQSRNCIGVITIGSYHHQFLVEQGVPEEKIILERQAVELPNVKVNGAHGSELRKRPRVISIGRMIEKKGFRYLIAAAQKLPEMDFVIYGYGPLELELTQLAKSLKVDNLVFGGSLDSTQALWTAYAEADIFALACVRASDGDLDGLPTVLVEAMASGLTVVSTRIANIPDLVVDGVTGFLANANDTQTLIEALQRAAAMTPGRRAHMLFAAHKRATSYASVERTMNTLLRRWRGDSIDIVLVTYDTGKYQNWTETEQIISRIFKLTAPPFEVYVVDNGSTENFLTKLTRNYGELPNFHIVRLGRNIFCGPATNVAIGQGGNKYIIYLCSKEGYVLQRGWEQDLVRYMDQNPEVGLAGHAISIPKHNDGESYQSLKMFPKFRNREFATENPSRAMTHIQGGAYVLRRSVFEAHGGFSEAVPQDGTDVEYSYYLESRGVQIGDIPNVYSATTKTIPGVESMLDENALIVHPLDRAKIERVERITRGEVCSCNICQWQGTAFLTCESDLEESVCPNCRSTRFSRTVLRLLSLDATLQRRPRGWAMLSEASLIPILNRLTTGLTLVKPDAPCSVSTWPKREETELVIIDHRPWLSSELRPLARWARSFVASGGALVMGGGCEASGDNDPLKILQKAGLALTAVAYDSAVFHYAWRDVKVANIVVHP
jgi:GT2 family glycosyltransferase/glycosyltransferase involved in cell wall biosynthesis